MRVILGSIAIPFPFVPGRIFLSGLVVACCCSCQTATTPTESEAGTASTNLGAGMKVAGPTGIGHPIKVLQYEMDYNAMVRGQKGLLSDDRDPWAQIPLPPGTTATVFGQAVDWQDGYFEMFTQRFVDSSFRGIEFGNPPKNLVRPYRGSVSRLNITDYLYDASQTLAGSRIGMNKVSDAKPVLSPSVRKQIVGLIEDGGTYVFCLRKEPAGHVEEWFGDVIAIIKPVATYRANIRNPVLWLTPENFVSYREYRFDESVEKVVSEISKDGSGYIWRSRERHGTLPIGSGAIERLLYALNTVDWVKTVDPLPPEAVQFTRKVIEFREGSTTKQLVWTDYLDQHGAYVPSHSSAPGRGILEHPDLGRMTGEYPVLIWGIFSELFTGP